jgi:hypothetical protein
MGDGDENEGGSIPLTGIDDSDEYTDEKACYRRGTRPGGRRECHFSGVGGGVFYVGHRGTGGQTIGRL